MVYNIMITDKAEELLDNILYYIIYRLKNRQTTEHLLSMIEKVYDNLETNPFLYKESEDSYLKSLGYREAMIPEMKYKVIFEIEDKEVTVLGFFHQLENYSEKM